MKIQWNGPERETDRERQIQIIEDFIDAREWTASSSRRSTRTRWCRPVEKLAALKIPCAIIDSGIATDKYVTYAATDNYHGGVLAARRMGEILAAREMSSFSNMFPAPPQPPIAKRVH